MNHAVKYGGKHRNNEEEIRDEILQESSRCCQVAKENPEETKERESAVVGCRQLEDFLLIWRKSSLWISSLLRPAFLLAPSSLSLELPHSRSLLLRLRLSSLSISISQSHPLRLRLSSLSIFIS
jgi:hypothetical protein